jgi:hypothetical protein
MAPDIPHPFGPAVASGDSGARLPVFKPQMDHQWPFPGREFGRDDSLNEDFIAVSVIGSDISGVVKSHEAAKYLYHTYQRSTVSLIGAE